MSVPVSPRRTKAAEKRASREATRTSAASASARPAPAAAPCTRSSRAAVVFAASGSGHPCENETALHGA